MDDNVRAPVAASAMALTPPVKSEVAENSSKTVSTLPVAKDDKPSATVMGGKPAQPSSTDAIAPQTPIPSTPSDNNNSIDDFFDDLSEQILVASQNGLFSQIDKPYKNEIDALIIAANESQAKKQTNQFAAQVFEIRRLFDECLEKAPREWRITHEGGIFHFLAVFVSTGVTVYCLIYASPLYGQWIPAWICCFGVCGAVLQVIYYLIKQINRRLLRRVWIVQCLFAPILGVLLSMAIYLGIKGGLIVFGADKATSTLNDYIIAIFCLYAGFKWEWALERLNTLIGTAEQK